MKISSECTTKFISSCHLHDEQDSCKVILVETNNDKKIANSQKNTNNKKQISMVTRNSVNANVKKGWHVNENDKVVDAIITRCNANNGLCPCHHQEQDGDLHCPCEGYRLHDKCVCNLYIADNE